MLLLPNTMTKKSEGFFKLSLTSLAAMRIATGLVILIDLIMRFQNLTEHYSDLGVMTRNEATQYTSTNWFPFIQMLGGSSEFVFVYFILIAIFAILLICGYRTLITSVIVWLLMVGLQNRNPLLEYGGDQTLRLILFWGMFLPWGKRYSIDSSKEKRGSKEKNDSSLASMAYIVQICCVYLFAGLSKSAPEWLHGDAVYNVLNYSQYTRPLGYWIGSFPFLTQLMTYSTLVIEFAAPIFLINILGNRAKTLYIVLLCMLQIGFNSTLQLGLFGVISIVSLIGLLPENVWTRVPRKIIKMFRIFAKKSSKNTDIAPKVSFGSRFSVLIQNFLIICSIIYVICINVGTVSAYKMVPKAIAPMANLIRLDQNWLLFSQVPYKNYNGVYVGVVTKNDTAREYIRIDTAQIVSKDDIENFQSKATLNERWRKLIIRLSAEVNKQYRNGFVQYLCRTYKTTNHHNESTRINSIQIIFVVKDIKEGASIDTSKYSLEKQLPLFFGYCE